MNAEWPDEASLLFALREGNAGAFEVLYRTHWWALYKIAHRYLESRQDAEEVIQALFEKIWRERQTLQIKKMGPYLAACAYHAAMDILRRKKGQAIVYDTEHLPDTAEELPDRIAYTQLQQRIDAAIGTLPDKTRVVFQKSRYEQKTVRQIAAEMELTEKAVEYHITKSIRHIKEFLKK
ncbi:sigma-70 family RNA polymerase sigma factor [Niabella pedocola]|uniref:Sigma-70 family RNA polymerase sigma factor n=1 Tax=Niabella pedocola TaxID=1752077 RepID=A0ABS8PVW9_9BACT|nr:sigma-70 family RNA polymerase sigma factor [Niabella pedocola]MCD2425217.1 sigma-70 family RNA polymerase sigma factor [Niabella pedocola]